jgi:2-haloacid dehalogenase
MAFVADFRQWSRLTRPPPGRNDRRLMTSSAAVELNGVKALTFDVFGTTMDWRASIVRELEALGEAKDVRADWKRFADSWRGGYGPAMNRVRNGDLPWTNLDSLHRLILDSLLPQFGLDSLSEAEREHLNRAWHRLEPMPDAVPGLLRLKQRYIIAPLSNGNVSLLTRMAKHAGLPWDCILSAELCRHYKYDPETYLMATTMLDVRPEELMMVAAHKGDLKAAHALGLKTAFVPRPHEYGGDRPVDVTPEPYFDVVAADFIDLADKLGA